MYSSREPWNHRPQHRTTSSDALRLSRATITQGTRHAQAEVYLIVIPSRVGKISHVTLSRLQPSSWSRRLLTRSVTLTFATTTTSHAYTIFLSQPLFFIASSGAWKQLAHLRQHVTSAENAPIEAMVRGLASSNSPLVCGLHELSGVGTSLINSTYERP